MFNKYPKNVCLILLLGCVIFLSTACDSGLSQDGIDALMPDGDLGIARQTEPYNYQWATYEALPVYDATLAMPFQVDVRNMNIEKFDLTDRLQDLLHADFTTETVWPAQLPEGFDPQAILENGLNPGLGIRDMHRRGITGEGVSVAVIDQTLFTKHSEYAERLEHYEELNIYYSYPMMHGAAVASLAVGERAGVAPDANLFFWAFTCQETLTAERENYAFVAKAIERALDLNAALQSDKKIRVISISKGFSQNLKGKKDYLQALERAKAEGVFVITASMGDEYGVQIRELVRAPYSDPDSLSSYTLPSAYHDLFVRRPERFENVLYVPASSRSYADISAPGAYAYCSEGATSWAVPYLAGVYALACQVNHDVTPQQFLTIAQSTADSIEIEIEGKTYVLNGVINPEALLFEIARSSTPQ